MENITVDQYNKLLQDFNKSECEQSVDYNDREITTVCNISPEITITATQKFTIDSSGVVLDNCSQEPEIDVNIYYVVGNEPMIDDVIVDNDGDELDEGELRAQIGQDFISIFEDLKIIDENEIIIDDSDIELINHGANVSVSLFGNEIIRLADVSSDRMLLDDEDDPFLYDNGQDWAASKLEFFEVSPILLKKIIKVVGEAADCDMKMQQYFKDSQ